MLQIVAQAFSQFERRAEHGGCDPGSRPRQPALFHPTCEVFRRLELVILPMRRAVLDEMADIERVGEVVSVGQRVGNLELAGLLRHRMASLEHH